MAPISRIQLILPRDGCEEKQRIWFFVEPSIKTISELIESVQAKVSVSEPCTLFLDDAILPEYETIQILRDGEAVSVSWKGESTARVDEVPVTKKKKRKEREVAEPEPVDTAVEIPQKKKRKRSKSHEEREITTQIEVNEPVLPRAADAGTPEAEITVEEVTGDSEVKHKRRRRRHHNRKTNEVEEIFIPTPVASVLPSPSPAVRQNHRTKHIRFDEEEPVEEIKNVEETTEETQMRVDTPSNNVNLLGTLTSLKSAVFVRSPSVTSTPQQPSGTSKEPNKDSFTFRPESYGLLTSQPRPGDVIAFKVLELGENYTPRLSDYYQAQVVSVSPFGVILLSLRNKPSGNLNKNGKFELVWDEEEESEPSTGHVTYQWNELIEPRLLSC